MLGINIPQALVAAANELIDQACLASSWQKIMMPGVSLAVSRTPTSWVVISMTGMALS